LVPGASKKNSTRPNLYTPFTGQKREHAAAQAQTEGAAPLRISDLARNIEYANSACTALLS